MTGKRKRWLLSVPAIIGFGLIVGYYAHISRSHGLERDEGPGLLRGWPGHDWFGDHLRINHSKALRILSGTRWSLSTPPDVVIVDRFEDESEVIGDKLARYDPVENRIQLAEDAWAEWAQGGSVSELDSDLLMVLLHECGHAIQEESAPGTLAQADERSLVLAEGFAQFITESAAQAAGLSKSWEDFLRRQLRLSEWVRSGDLPNIELADLSLIRRYWQGLLWIRELQHGISDNSFPNLRADHVPCRWEYPSRTPWASDLKSALSDTLTRSTRGEGVFESVSERAQVLMELGEVILARATAIAHDLIGAGSWKLPSRYGTQEVLCREFASGQAAEGYFEMVLSGMLAEESGPIASPWRYSAIQTAVVGREGRAFRTVRRSASAIRNGREELRQEWMCCAGRAVLLVRMSWPMPLRDDMKEDDLLDVILAAVVNLPHDVLGTNEQNPGILVVSGTESQKSEWLLAAHNSRAVLRCAIDSSGRAFVPLGVEISALELMSVWTEGHTLHISIDTLTSDNGKNVRVDAATSSESEWRLARMDGERDARRLCITILGPGSDAESRIVEVAGDIDRIRVRGSSRYALGVAIEDCDRRGWAVTSTLSRLTSSSNAAIEFPKTTTCSVVVESIKGVPMADCVVQIDMWQPLLAVRRLGTFTTDAGGRISFDVGAARGAQLSCRVSDSRHPSRFGCTESGRYYPRDKVVTCASGGDVEIILAPILASKVRGGRVWIVPTIGARVDTVIDGERSIVSGVPFGDAEIIVQSKFGDEISVVPSHVALSESSTRVFISSE